MDEILLKNIRRDQLLIHVSCFYGPVSKEIA